MQLVQVKRLGPGKFYLSHKGDHAFIKGNPSSHKAWMRRFFFVKRVGKKRDPWKCEMSWRDNIYILTPRTPERSPNLASFLNAMCDKSYNAPELIQEDILCFFGFSRRGIELVGDLGIVVSRLSCVMICSRAYALSGLTFTLFFFVHERMDKAEMLRAMEGAEAASSGASALPTKATKKRKASTPADKEARRQRKKKRASTSEMPGRAFRARARVLPSIWPMRIGLKCRTGRARRRTMREGPVRNWDLVLRRATREGASAKLGFSAQVGLPPEEVPVLIGLMCSRRRATGEGASVELGFSAQVGLPLLE
ncbi:hypothetical protein F511_42927 [Dorcoceras hygrometricum]|uniref:Uncharacterized protein n=1 Tax=Dorcoceras hygrometricum TaxID=472368 RepID=A0A2Z7A5X1_9LAMI|nr:hypothetical protein F511_42927 [Dorcoceras hygrometricum]